MTAANTTGLPKRLWYDFLRFSSRLCGVSLFGLRCYGRENWPATGGGLVLSNHQSHFDPVLVGLTCNRRLNYLARDSLFRFAPFRLLIESLDAIPVDREGLGLNGLKETLRRLKRGEFVLMFPEGTRTTTGQVTPLKPGFSALATRANVPIIPVAIDGAFQLWPRKNAFPLLWGCLHIHIGKPMPPEEVKEYSDRELIRHLQQQLTDLHAAARTSRKRSLGKR